MNKYQEILIPMRKENVIGRATEEFVDKVWYDRKQVFFQNLKTGKEKCEKEILKKCKKGVKELEKKYGKKNLGPWTKFEWGMINGKLSALRWVLGYEWDDLDT